MSFNIAFAAKGRDEAKADLAQRCKEAGNVPAKVAAAVTSLIDAMPDTDMEGYNTLNVASYGHFRKGKDDNPGTSNLTIQLQWTADVG